MKITFRCLQVIFNLGDVPYTVEFTGLMTIRSPYHSYSILTGGVVLYSGRTAKNQSKTSALYLLKKYLNK